MADILGVSSSLTSNSKRREQRNPLRSTILKRSLSSASALPWASTPTPIPINHVAYFIPDPQGNTHGIGTTTLLQVGVGSKLYPRGVYG